MTFYLVIGFAGILLILGIIYIVRGMGSSDVVPLSDISEIRKLSEPEDSSGQLKVIQAQGEVKLAKPSISLIKHLLKDSQQQNQATVSSPIKENQAIPFKPSSVAQPPSAVSQPKQASVDEGKKVHEQSADERIQLSQQKAKYEELEQNVERLKKIFDQEKQREVYKLKSLEAEVTRLQNENQALTENTLLHEKLKGEKQSLVEQLRKSEERAKELIENIAAIKSANEQSLQQVREAMQNLQLEQKQFQKAHDAAMSKELEEAINRVVSYEQQVKDLIQAKSKLEEELSQNKQFNAELLEKERSLQYELAKSRAQMLGLERMCEDFKVLIDRMSQSQEA